MQRVSVIEPIGRAWQRMMLICFRPFDFTRWLALGFCAFLAYLAERIGSGLRIPNFAGGGGGRGGGGRGGGLPAEIQDAIEKARTFIDEYMVLIIVGALVAMVVGLAVYLLLHWLRARGEFMFVDGIATNRRQEFVVRPWKEYARQANSFFLFQSAMGLIKIACYVLVLLLCVWIAWPDIQALAFGDRAIKAIVVFAFLFPVALIALATILACNRAFVLPIMYARGLLFWPAWREFWKEIVPGHIGSLILFFTMYVVLTLGGAVVMGLGSCLTCCLGALPYISSVLFLPVLVFLRCYSICYLEQFGTQYTILSHEEPGRGFEVIMPPGPNQPLPPAPPPGV